MSYKRLFLVRSKISDLLVNMLTGNYEYSSSSNKSLLQPIYMELSEKRKTLWQFFIAHFKFKLNLT